MFNSLDNYIASLNPTCWLNSQHVSGYGIIQPEINSRVGLWPENVFKDISGNERNAFTDLPNLQPLLKIDSNGLYYLEFTENLLAVAKPVTSNVVERTIVIIAKLIAGNMLFQQNFYGYGSNVKQFNVGSITDVIGYHNYNEAYSISSLTSRISTSTRPMQDYFFVIADIKENSFLRTYSLTNNLPINIFYSNSISCGNYSRTQHSINFGGRGIGVNLIEGDNTTFQLYAPVYCHCHFYEYIDFDKLLLTLEISRLQSYIKTKYNL